MSLRAILWALEDAECPTPQAKLCLAIFANFANDKNLAYPALASVRKMTGLDERTIRRCVADLEAAGLLIDTGQRVGRTKNVRVFAVPVRTPANMSGLKSGDAKKSSVSSDVGGGKNRTPANMSGFDAACDPNPCKNDGVTPANMSGEPVTEPKPLDKPIGLSVPKGTDRPARGSRISEDWTAPPIGALPDRLAAVVSHWPDGAYADQAAAFADFWAGESGPRAFKVNWDKAWHGWIRRAGKVEAPVAAKPAPAPRKPTPLVQERDAEGDWEKRFRAVLEPHFGKASWWETAAFRHNDPGVYVLVYSWQRDSVSQIQTIGKIQQVAEAAGMPVKWVSVSDGKLRR